MSYVTIPPRPVVSRLPASHRQYVEALEARLREFESAAESEGQTRVIVDPYGAARHIDSHSKVRFDLRTAPMRYDRYIDCELTSPFVQGRDERMTHVQVTGSDSIEIIPASSNLVYIAVRNR